MTEEKKRRRRREFDGDFADGVDTLTPTPAVHNSLRAAVEALPSTQCSAQSPLTLTG